MKLIERLRQLFASPTATPPPSWPTSWHQVLNDPRGAIDADAWTPAASMMLGVAGLGDVREMAAEARIAWAQQLGFLPTRRAWDEAMARGTPLRAGGVEVFLEASSARHQLAMTREELDESLREQMGEGEAPVTWRLCASDGEVYWYVDASVAPRLRLLKLEFSYDHLHLRDELSSFGALKQESIRHALFTVAARLDAPDCDTPAFNALPLDLHARALSAALALIGAPCDARVVAQVAGVPAREMGWAIAQLKAAGELQTFTPPNWQWGQGLIPVPGKATEGGVDEAAIREMKERLEELGPLEPLPRDGARG